MDERALIESAKTSAAGFGELFDKYYERVYAYAYRRVGSRAAAEDIAANVFEDALRGIKRYAWQDKPFVAWLYRIASRRVADFYRRGHADVQLDSETLIADGDTNGGLERIEEYAAVRRGLERLSASEREVIRLVYLDELDGDEIAAMLNCTANNVYVRTHRALKKLKAILETDMETDTAPAEPMKRTNGLASGFVADRVRGVR